MNKTDLENRIRELELELGNLKSDAIATSNASKKTIEAEKALFDSEERFKLLFDEAPLGYQSLDIDGNFIEVNQQWLDTLGYSREEVIGKWFGDFMSLSSQNQVRKKFPEFIVKGEIHAEFEMVHKNSSIIIIGLEGRIGHDLNGEFKQTHCILQDITKHKQLEDALMKSEAKHSSMISNISDVIAIIGADGFVKYQSPNIEKWFGWQPKDLIGTDAWLTVHPDDLQRIQKEFFTLLEKEKSSTTVMYKYKCKDGSYKLVELTAKNLTDDSNINGVLLNFHDITERKLSEEKQLKNQYYLSKAQEIGFIGTWELDIQKNILIWTDENYKIFGVPLGTEVTYELFLNCIHPDDRDYVNEKWSAGLRNEPYDIEHRLIVNDKVKWVREKADIQFDTKGKPIMAIGFCQDITERKQDVETLRENEKFLNETQVIANLGTYTMEIATGKWVSSEVLDKIFGIDSDFDKSVEGWTSIIHPEWQNIMTDYFIQEVIGNKTKFDKEYKIVRKNDNAERWLHGIGNLKFDKNDQPITMIGTIQDITQRKDTEKVLLKLNMAVNNTDEVIFMTDKEGTITYTNMGFTNMYGFTPEEVVGKATPRILNSGLYPKDYYEQFWNAILTKQRVPTTQYINKCKNGKFIDVEGSADPIIDEKGEIIGFLGIQRDISKRKQADIELQAVRETADANSANVTAIIEGTADSIWAFNRNFEIIYINEVFKKEFQQTFGVWLEPGVSLIEALPEAIRPLWEPRYDRVLANEQFAVEDAIDTGYGTIYIQVAFNPIVKNGQVIGGSCFGSNITSRKLAEIELVKAKEKAEESDRLKSAFLANMSHEIRTPMNGILGFADLLKEPNLTGEEQQEFIEIIGKFGERMLDTINNIVDMSKIESGLMQVNITELNINEQIQFAYNFFKPEAESKGLQLLFNNGLPEEEAIIKSDHEKVYAVLINLIKNAIKYSDKGLIVFGYNILESHDSTDSPHTHFLEFFVKDSGIGIPKERQEAIFERFIQADIGYKRAFQGSGLGLSISKSYVEILGGEMWVESEEGRGSVFYFTIPYDAGAEEKNTIKNVITKKIKEVQIKKLKILIAEDDETSRNLLAMRVKKLSKEILNAENGIDAVELCRNNPDIDLILMDILMPEMDGIEATRQIRQFNKDVIIIAQTAYGFSSDRKKAIESGCNDYISKPINYTLLIELINEHCNR